MFTRKPHNKSYETYLKKAERIKNKGMLRQVREIYLSVDSRKETPIPRFEDINHYGRLKELAEYMKNSYSLGLCVVWYMQEQANCDSTCLYRLQYEEKENSVCGYPGVCMERLVASGKQGKEKNLPKILPFVSVLNLNQSKSSFEYQESDVPPDPIYDMPNWGANLGYVSYFGFYLRDFIGNVKGFVSIFDERVLPTKITDELTEFTEVLEESAKDYLLWHNYSSMSIQLNKTQKRLKETEESTNKLIVQANKNLQSTNQYLKNKIQVMERHQQELIQTMVQKEEIIKKVVHDLKSPLTAICGISQLLEQTDLDTEQRCHLSIIQTASKTSTEMINNILEYAKFEGRSFHLKIQPFSLAELLKETQSFFEYKCNEGFTRLLFDTELGEIDQVSGDRLLLQEILSNLLSNALKFTSRGSVKVVSRTYDEKENIRFSCRVEDTGIGIQKENLEKIFEPYVQINEINEFDQKSTGLGLSICKELVELMDGSIQVESTPGNGSIFSFDVSLAKPS